MPRNPPKEELWERDVLLSLADAAEEEAQDALQLAIFFSRQEQRQSALATLRRTQADRLGAGPASHDRPLGRLILLPLDNATKGE
jgi:hypothetical protein